jgi:hypothetical protein
MGEEVSGVASITRKASIHCLLMSLGECLGLRRPSWVILGEAKKQVVETLLILEVDAKNLVI